MVEDTYWCFDFTAMYIYAVQFYPNIYFPFPLSCFSLHKFAKGEGKHLWSIWAALQFFSRITMAGHSWREGIKVLKDYQHSCLSLAGQHRALGHSVEELWYISFNDQIWQTCVGNLLWAEKCWCLEVSQQIPSKFLRFRPQWRQGQIWCFFFVLLGCDLLRDIFLENQVDVAWWKFRPLGDGVDYSFFLYRYKIHPCLASAVIFHCRWTWCCERRPEIICSIFFHLGPYPCPGCFCVSPTYGRMSTGLRIFKVLGKFSFSLWALFQHKLMWGMLMLGRRT